MAFGTLATVNGSGDLAASIIVGLLWTSFGTSVAFGYSAALFVCGSVTMLRVASKGSLADQPTSNRNQ